MDQSPAVEGCETSPGPLPSLSSLRERARSVGLGAAGGRDAVAGRDPVWIHRTGPELSVLREKEKKKSKALGSPGQTLWLVGEMPGQQPTQRARCQAEVAGPWQKDGEVARDDRSSRRPGKTQGFTRCCTHAVAQHILRACVKMTDRQCAIHGLSTGSESL